MSEDARAETVSSAAWSLIAGVFLGGVGGGVAFPTLPALGPILGFSPLLVGVILSINRVTRLVVNAPVGQVLDTRGTRRPMLFGFLLQGAAPLGYAFALRAGEFGLSSAAVFLLARVCWGVGSSFVNVGAFSTITHITTESNRGRWIGFMRAGQSLGFPTGLVMGGLVADAFGYGEAFVVAGVAGLLAAVAAAALLPDVGADVDTATSLRDLPALLRADTRVLAVSFVNLAVRFLYAGVLLSTVVLYATHYGIAIGSLSGTGVSGVVMAVGAAAVSVTTLAVGRYSDRLSNRAVVTLPALGALGSGFALLALVPTLPGAFAGVVLVGVGVGGTGPPLLAYLGDISPAETVGKLGGVYNVFGDLGSALGPIVALPLVDLVGFTGEYLGCALLVVVVGGLVARTLSGARASTGG